MNRKANLGFAAALFTMVVLAAAAVLVLQNSPSSITGALVYQPSVPSYCLAGNNASCIDLTGDGTIDGDDEDIFALILDGTITKYSNRSAYEMADFDGDGTVDNAVDFQQCFVPLRDYYKDIYDGKIGCNLPKGAFGEPNFTQCKRGCPDLNGDGYVNSRDFSIFGSLIGNSTFWANYPGADMKDPVGVGAEDKECMTLFMGRIVTCNMPRHYLHTQNCPDLTNSQGTGNDGYVDEDDEVLFDTYKLNQNLKADFDGNGKVDWIDEHIFNQYFGRVVNCDIYHAPWHIGGINKENTFFNNTYSTFGGSYNLSQSFVAGYEGILPKIRIRLWNNTASGLGKVTVTLYDANETSDRGPNQTFAIASASLVPSFELNRSSWITMPFRTPPVLEEGNMYHLVISSPTSSDNAYRWYWNNVTAKNLTEFGAQSWVAAATGLQFGESTATGDINNDGYDDMIIADPTRGSGTNAGSVYLTYGPFYGTGVVGTSTNASWNGGATADFFGSSVATGDFDGNGYDDILIGSYGRAMGAYDGGAYILYGPVDDVHTSIYSEYNTYFEGSSASYVGTAVASGDFNLDGKDDIIIGADQEGGATKGAVYIIPGPYYGGPHDPEDAYDIKIYADKSSIELGNQIDIGDINGDGKDDLVLGVREYDSGYVTGSGAVFVFYGPLTGNREINLSKADAVWYGETVNDYAGESVAIGDFNNDGYDDIAAGAIDADATALGLVYIVYGPTYGTNDFADAGTIFYQTTGSNFGSAVSAGDFNNDGYDDIISTDYWDDRSGNQNEGAAYVVYGPFKEERQSIKKAAGTKIWGDSTSDEIGETPNSISAGDFNNDGYEDVLIGAPDAGSSSYGEAYLLYGPLPINVNGSYWNQSNSPGWDNNSDMDFLFQVWESSACADLNADGEIDTDDEDLILEIPDQLRYSGTVGWNPAYDFNDDGKITSDDSGFLSGYVGSGNELVNITEAAACSAILSTTNPFGKNVSLAQPFRADVDSTYLELNYIELRLGLDAGSGTKDIVLEIREEGTGGPDMNSSPVASTTMAPVTSQTLAWYIANFSSPPSLVSGGEYFIVLSSPDSTKINAYKWAECGISAVSGQETISILENESINATQKYIFSAYPSTNSTFRIFEGNTDSLNSTLDVNSDGRLNSADYEIVLESEGNWSGQKWSGKVDFNAEFGVYEKLKDYTLGFTAYLSKVGTCGLPNWVKGLGNKRCDVSAPYNETFTSTSDCADCDYNGFCSISEDFTYCSDCLGSLATVIYTDFGCDTTDFLDAEQNGTLEAVPNAVIEDCDYGKINLSGTSNFTGLSLDNEITISSNFISVKSPTLDAIDLPANLSFYNLTYVHPWVVHDGSLCPSAQCTFTSFKEKSGGKNDYSFEVAKVGTVTNWTTIQLGGASSNVYASLELDDFGRPHVVYRKTTNDIVYVKWSGLAWVNATVDTSIPSSARTSITINSKNYPHAAYAKGNDIMAARFAGNEWKTETAASFAAAPSLPSIDLDSNDRGHIAFKDSLADLNYIYYENNSWSSPVVIDSGNGVNYISLKVDSNNDIHISYENQTVLGTTWNLVYAYCADNCGSASSWTKTIVDPATPTGIYSSLELDSNNNPHIAYRIGTGSLDLKYAFCDGSCDIASNWNRVTVESTGNIGSYCSLALDSSNNPHISYAGAGAVGLKYAYCADNCNYAASWTKEDVSTGNSIAYTSIDVDKYDNLYISYEDTTAGTLNLSSRLSYTNYTSIEAAPRIVGFTGNMTTDLSPDVTPDLSSVSNFTLHNSYGAVIFEGNVNLTPVNLVRLDISKYLKITRNNFTINVTALPMLNTSVTVVFFGINYVYPALLQNGASCTQCHTSSEITDGFAFSIDSFNDSAPSYLAVELAPDVTAFEPVVPAGITTNFSPNYVPDITNYTGAVLKNTYGQVQFLEPADYTGLNLSNTVQITQNQFSPFGSSGSALQINVSSEITLFNLSFTYPGVVFKDTLLMGNDKDCNICKVKSYAAATNLLFNITHFNGSALAGTELAPDVTAFDSATDFSYSAIADIESVPNVFLANSSAGRIDFLEPVNASKRNYSRDIIITNGSIFVNTTNLTSLNSTSADITLYDLDMVYPVINLNSSRCPHSICKFIYYEPDTDLKFNVTGFSSTPSAAYSVSEGAPNVTAFNGSSTTDFSRIGSALSDFDIENMSGMTLEKEGFGKLRFLEQVNVSNGSLEWSKYINLSLNGAGSKVSINTTMLPNLNKSAEATFYSLSLVTPLILYLNNESNITACPSSICRIISYPSPSIGCKTNASCTLVFNVTHFSSYWATENSTAPRFIETIPDQLMYENQNATIQNLSRFVFDPDNATLIYSASANCTEITPVINQATTDITFVPDPGWNGICTAEVNVSDGTDSDSQNITLTVIENIPPQFRNGPITIPAWNEDDNATVNLSYYFWDPDYDVLFFNYSFLNPGYRNITVTTNQTTGIAVLDPDSNWYGTRYIRFSAADEKDPTWSSPFTTLNVNSVNDLPDLIKNIPDSTKTFITIQEDHTKNISLNNHFNDVEDGKNLYYYLQNSSIYFNVTFNQTSHVVMFVPDENWNGYESFTIIANDTDGGSTPSNVFIIYVTAVADPPVVLNSSPYIEMVEETPYVNGSSAQWFFDPDNDSIYIYDSNPNITVNINFLTGMFNLTPVTDFTGITYINFSAVDGVHRASTFAKINVTNVDDPPYQNATILMMSWPEDTVNSSLNLSKYFHDPDFQQLNYSVDSLPANVAVSVNSTTGIVTLTPSANFTGINYAVFAAEDPDSNVVLSNNVTLYVTPVNDKPTALAFPNLNWGKDTNRTVFLLNYFTDIDGDVLNYSAHNGTNISVYISNISKTAVLEPAAGWSGTSWVIFTAHDSMYSVNSTNITLNVVLGPSKLVNTRIDGILMPDGNYTNLTNIVISNLTNSFVNDTRTLFGSRVNDSTLVNTSLDNCNIDNSALNHDSLWDCNVSGSTLISVFAIGCSVTDSYVDPSNLTGSTITGSSNIIDSNVIDSDVDNGDITNSEVYDTTVNSSEVSEDSVIHDSTIKDSTVINTSINISTAEENALLEYSGIQNCTVSNSWVRYSQAANCTIINGTLINGTLTFNGTTYTANNTDTYNLTDIINYAPSASFTASSTSVKLGSSITFTSTSTDPNIPGGLSDSLTYRWDMDDGAKSNSSSLNHTYNTLGTYVATLAVNDTFNETSTALKTITVSKVTSTGGGGGGSSRCAESWNCSEWSVCASNRYQSRQCIDLNACGTANYMPALTQSCDYIETCADYVLNQDETSADCGGSICSPCSDGKYCISNADCVNDCINNICSYVAPVQPPITEPQPPAQYIPPPPPIIEEPAAAGLLDMEILGIGMWVYAIAGMVAIVLIIGGIAVGTHRHKAHAGAPAGAATPVTYSYMDSLRTAIKRDIVRGVPEASIRNALLGTGWSAYIVDQAIEEINKAMIASPAEGYINRGYNEARLKKALETKGWPSSIVDDVIEDVNLSILRNAMRKNAAKGIAEEEVKTAMVEKGWPEELVERAAGEFRIAK